MRLVVSLLLFCAILAGAIFAFTVVTNPSKTYGFFAGFSGSESLEKHSLVAFVPPRGIYRISFPALKPGELTELTQYMRQSPLPSPQYFVGDRELGFFSTSYETDLSLAEKPKEEGNGIYEITQTSVVAPANLSQLARSYDPMEIQRFLDTKCDDIARKVDATISVKTALSLKGGAFPGRNVEGSFKNTKNAFRMRIFLDQANKRIVAIAVVGTPKRVYSKQATQFLNSLDMWS